MFGAGDARNAAVHRMIGESIERVRMLMSLLPPDSPLLSCPLGTWLQHPFATMGVVGGGVGGFFGGLGSAFQFADTKVDGRPAAVPGGSTTNYFNHPLQMNQGASCFNPPQQMNLDQDTCMDQAQQQMNQAVKRKAEEDAVSADTASHGGSPPPPVEQPQIYGCALCRVDTGTLEGLNEHIQTNQHKTAELGLKSKRAKTDGGDGSVGPFYCTVCNLNTSGEESYKEHCQGKKHKAAQEKAEALAKSKEMDFELADGGGNAEKEHEVSGGQGGVVKGVVDAGSDESKTAATTAVTGNGGVSENAGESGGGAVFSCSLCKLTTISKEQLNEHCRGKKHKAAVEKVNAESGGEKQPDKVKPAKPAKGHTRNSGLGGGSGTDSSAATAANAFFCSICNVSTSCQKVFDTHILGKKHKAKAAAAAASDDKFVCKICLVTAPSSGHLAAHLNGAKHKAAEKLAANVQADGGGKQKQKQPASAQKLAAKTQVNEGVKQKQQQLEASDKQTMPLKQQTIAGSA